MDVIVFWFVYHNSNYFPFKFCEEAHINVSIAKYFTLAWKGMFVFVFCVYFAIKFIFIIV